MASLFGHAAVALTAVRALPHEKKGYRFWFWGVVCAICPDVDVIGFGFGISYYSQWGHRGFTHSLVFAAVLGMLVAAGVFKAHKKGWLVFTGYSTFFGGVTATHLVLDALTNGGLGVAAFWPIDKTRYFFPYRPIEVSPIGVAEFFSSAGWAVVQSEFVFIGIPCLIVASMLYAWKR